MDEEKIRNMLTGIAVGDAFGLGIEFQDRDWIRENVDFTRYADRREGRYAEGYAPGFYSDDTEHSIGLMKALMRPEPFTQELLLRMWRREYEDDRKAKGFPRQGHGTIKDWYDGRKTIEEIKAVQAAGAEPGCSSAMRAVPLGLVDHDLINEYAIINADATNYAEKARSASILVARASEYTIAREGDPEGIFEYCKDFITDTETLDYLARVELLPDRQHMSESDFEALCGPQPLPYFKDRVVMGLPNSAMRVAGAALYITRHAEDAFGGLKDAIRLGGDVDSIASVCTGILGGRYGLDSLPEFMIGEIEGKERIRDVAARFSAWLKNSH